MISGSSEASQSYIKENATKQKKNRSSKPRQIEKEGKVDYFTVGGAAVTSWMSKSALAPCQEPKRTQVERSHPPKPSQQEGGKCPQPDTHTRVRRTATAWK